MSYEHALKSFDSQSVLIFTISSFVASVYRFCFAICLNPKYNVIFYGSLYKNSNN